MALANSLPEDHYFVYVFYNIFGWLFLLFLEQQPPETTLKIVNKS